ncbi:MULTISPECIES: DUF6188 family protein [Mycobacteriaceae]|jgi:hypothetical protein|uniref:Uncharacterized protein n=3 Tax=Mycolicibacter TaxID=1073531 RepID=A0A0F5MXL4_9MYCO|nr:MULTISPECIES: DUF6188 family protein [Mycobacteriaceae]UVO12517.1 DUF6188 family protein [Mycobacterium sp. SVM_VP21]KAA1430175.1 hypothetical protein F0402_15335 [Mycolicibacter arupensis]KKB98767.1 hypothetical protein WR43_12815 [Mycolicibacter arupensis]MCV7275615.1 hypothetical protein [Mycolicibacter arupensis]MCV7386068.1 hypothetical protein [Mycolicibacter longobardus]
MYTQWIQACTVQRVSLRGGLMLGFDDGNEVVIYSPLLLTLPAVGDFPIEAVFIDPARVATHEIPLLDFAGAVCTQAWCGDGGALHLGFSSGHGIDVDAHPEVTAWELYGRHHGYMACLPQGRVRVVRYDVPEAYDSEVDLAARR